jgi:hypothetical protein
MTRVSLLYFFGEKSRETTKDVEFYKNIDCRYYFGGEKVVKNLLNLKKSLKGNWIPIKISLIYGRDITPYKKNGASLIGKRTAISFVM